MTFLVVLFEIRIIWTSGFSAPAASPCDLEFGFFAKANDTTHTAVDQSFIQVLDHHDLGVDLEYDSFGGHEVFQKFLLLF